MWLNLEHKRRIMNENDKNSKFQLVLDSSWSQSEIFCFCIHWDISLSQLTADKSIRIKNSLRLVLVFIMIYISFYTLWQCLSQNLVISVWTLLKFDSQFWLLISFMVLSMALCTVNICSECSVLSEIACFQGIVVVFGIFRSVNFFESSEKCSSMSFGDRSSVLGKMKKITINPMPVVTQ